MKFVSDWLITMLLSKRVLSILSFFGAAIIFRSEYDWATMPFAGFIFSTLVTIFLLFSRRFAFSMVLTWTLFIVVTAVSQAKFKYLNLSLVAPDLYFYMKNKAVINYVSQYFIFWIVLCIMALTLGLIVTSTIYYREEKTMVSPMRIILLLFLSLSGIYLTYPVSASKGGGVYYSLSGHRTTSFFVSLANVRYLFGHSHLESELSEIQSKQIYKPLADRIGTQKKNPDIIVVLMESAMPPALFPKLKTSKYLDQSFKSHQERMHFLRTETFGGGTWISITGFMTSLPTCEFGWMKPYLPITMKDKIHHSLPQFLKDYGYATAAISSGSGSLINEKHFLTSLGIDNYFDYKAINAPTLQERDEFYFNAALKFIEEHHRTDKRPLFLFIMTMSTHAPYNYRFDPMLSVTGEPFGNEPEIDEYLRRLTMQRLDFKQFKVRLKQQAAKNGTLVVDFGDHQPSVTRKYAEAIDGEKSLAEFNSIAYLTYYSITPINMKLASPTPDFASLDIAYLAPTILTAAGLPIDEVYHELLDMRNLYHGSHTGCSTHNRKLLHLKKLVNSKMMEFPH